MIEIDIVLYIICLIAQIYIVINYQKGGRGKKPTQ